MLSIYNKPAELLYFLSNYFNNNTRFMIFVDGCLFCLFNGIM